MVIFFGGNPFVVSTSIDYNQYTSGIRRARITGSCKYWNELPNTNISGREGYTELNCNAVANPMDTINAIKALHQQPMRPPKLVRTPIDTLTTFDTFTELFRKKLLHHRDQYFQFRDNRQFAGYR